MRHRSRVIRTTAFVVFLAAALSAPVTGQTPREPQPTPGVSFTPEMARLVAGVFVQNVAKNRYSLPDDKLEEARETVARRLMEFAHSVDGPGHELVQRYLEEQFKYLAQDAPARLIPPSFGKEFADRAAPLVPNIRDLIKGVGQDLRPMLPMKQQLRLAGDLMAANTAVNGFEQLMQLWSSGQDTTYSNPFRDQPEIRRDESGISAPLQTARQQAKRTAERSWSKYRTDYLTQFKKLYELDAAQAATADSIWREFDDREKTLLQDAAVNRRMYVDDLWLGMSDHLPDTRRGLVRWIVRNDLEDAFEVRIQLDMAFKHRLESIPTEAQRRRADERVMKLLKEKGLLTAETKP